MSEVEQQTGRCLCGRVEIRLTASHHDVDVCHCAMCRRWAGGPWMGMRVEHDIEISGREHVGVFRSSDWAERAFCRVCGSNLYWRVVEKDIYYLSVGVLDATAGLRLAMQMFIDDKPGFYDIAGDAPRLTGAEVVALFAPPPVPDERR
jgi:hypothetical protein